MARNVYILNIEGKQGRRQRTFSSAAKVMTAMAEYGSHYADDPIRDLHNGEDVWVDGAEIFAEKVSVL